MAEDRKQVVNIRLTPEAVRLLESLQSRKGISRTALIELAVRAYADRELVSPSPANSG